MIFIVQIILETVIYYNWKETLKMRIDLVDSQEITISQTARKQEDKK